MGLLTMLSRRSGRFQSRQSREDLRRSQQDAPLQTSRPVSASTYSTYEPPSTPSYSETQFSDVSPIQAIDTNAAKPPLNTAFRGVLDNFRPGSSGSFGSGYSDRPRTMQRPKREPRKPPVSFRKPSSLSSTQSSVQSSVGEPLPPQIARASVSDAVSFTERGERTASMTSLSRRLSKDILDAVDEFRPLDFRSRVQAAGARDYGEDVADRNLRLFPSVSSPNMYAQFSSVRPHSSQSMNFNSRTKSINSINEHFDATPRALPFYADPERSGFSSRRNKHRLSLNTYKPSGFVPSLPPTPRSYVTTPGQDGPLTPSDVDSPDARHDMWSRPYHTPSAVSNFSLPRSPMRARYSNEAHKPQLGQADQENDFTEKREFGDVSRSNQSNHRKSDASDFQRSTKAAARFSQGTYRSSLASSMTSRCPSMDFMPLGYPRLQGHAKMDSDISRLSDDVRMWRSQSLRKSHFFQVPRPDTEGSLRNTDSHKHSRSSSSGNNYNHQRTKSLLAKPTGLSNLVEADGPTHQPHISDTQDWALVTTSTGSASSSSNGLFSGTSGSMRPMSRHTKATSLDSIPRPLSSQSGLSATVGQSADGWSPSTARSTGFNIDDYISSDDDSFTTKQRPTGEGEEELLFKGGYGATGAALPGLLESPLSVSARRVMELRGPSQLLSPSETAEEGAEDEHGDGAAEGPDIDDNRHHEFKRDMPFMQLRYAQAKPEREGLRVFGKQLIRPRAQSNAIPSWLPSDDWARPGSRRSSQTKRPVTSHSSTSNTSISEDLRPPRRGQIRLSALGALPGQDLDDVIDDSGDAAKRTKSNEPVVTNVIKEETDPSVAARLRKEAKARKREDETRTIRERRMTRAFGRLNEDQLAALQQQEQGEDETIERGRTRERVLKGKSVLSS